MRLFHGNPNLLEISMQGNNLRTLDAAQFPIDRINRLNLGDNPLECNCSLLWLWRLVTAGSLDNIDSSSTTTNKKSSIHYQRHYHHQQQQQQQSDDPEPEYNDIDHNNNNIMNDQSPQEIKDNTNYNNYLILDSERIGCDIITTSDDQIKIRKLLRNMDENEITCPAHIVTIVCAILSSFVVLMTGASILFYLRIVKRRRKLLNDRRNGKQTILNIHDRIIQQHHTQLQHHSNNYHHHNNHLQNSQNHLHHLQNNHHTIQTTNSIGVVDDKLELERYLAAQAISNEYRALKPWEIPIKDTLDDNESTEHHYEKFDHYEYPDTRPMSKPHVVYV